MTREGLSCSVVTDRLVSGERPNADPALAAHVGSCLLCFRTANDLKAVPELRRQLLEAEGQADPGSAFWAAFPGQVASAWEAAQAAKAAPPEVVKADRPARRLDLRERFWTPAVGWLRRPIPAAFAGALAAAAVLLVVIRPGTQPAPTIAAGALTAAQLDRLVENPTGMSVSAGGLVPGGAIDESLKDLDVDELVALRNGLERSLTDEVGARASAYSDEPAAPNAAALADEFEELDDAGLVLLAENLVEPI
jgi:hypothetical protein